MLLIELTVACPLEEGGRISVIIFLVIGNIADAIIAVTPRNIIKLTICFTIADKNNANETPDKQNTNNHFLPNRSLIHPHTPNIIALTKREI